MNFDNLHFLPLKKIKVNFIEGGIYCFPLEKYADLYHTFMIYKINDINNNIEIIHFYSQTNEKDNCSICKDNIYDIIGNRKIAKIKFHQKPINNLLRRRRIAYNIYLNFFDWPKYHIILNNCHHFIHYCLYNEMPLICGQNEEVIKFGGAAILSTLGFGILFTKYLKKIKM